MVQNSSNQNICKNHIPSVKITSGASIVKKKLLFSFDSRFILVPSGCDVKVFSISSGECFLNFKGHREPVVGIQISKRNNLQALSCSEDGIVIRWDYSDGTTLESYELQLNSSVCAFIAPTIDVWFFTSKFEGHFRLYSVKIKSPKINFKTQVFKYIDPHDNSIAIGYEGSYAAAISDNSLHVKDFESGRLKRHMVGKKKLLCVAAHPTEYMLATGDDWGCILVWSDFIESNHPTRSIYHWHSLPLNDLIFSVEGSHVYSGGGESVLVKWNLNSNTKQILPRLGLPICRLAVSPDNTYIATSHIDNAIQVITSQNKVVQIIQGLTQGHCCSKSVKEVLPTGMLYDSRLHAVVMNGKPGHLQFYNIDDDRQLFNLDIVGQNIISQERNSVIFNTDIEKAAIDNKGLWLATIECRDDGETSPEIRLKFWKFEATSQKFVLNTNIFLPHHKKINSIKFRPVIEEEELKYDRSYSHLAVTTSSDGRFKIWTLSEADTTGEKFNWTCELMGYYKELPGGDSCFSEDGSLLAVSFNNIITLWSPETNVLKATLSKSENLDPIRHLEFGKGKCSHFLVSHTDTKVTIWDVLSLSVLWNVKCEVQYLTADPYSDIMALFLKDNALYIFKPNNPKPITILKNVSSSPIIAAVFIPNKASHNCQEEEACCWQQYSKLYFFNEKQEILTVAEKVESPVDESNSEKIKLQQNIPVTPFGLLQAETKISHVKSIEPKEHILYKFVKEENIDVSNLPCPTNVNPIALCTELLPSLLMPRNSEKENEPSEMKKNTTSDSEDSDIESDVKQKMDTKQLTSESKSQKSKPMDTNEYKIPELEDFEYLIDSISIE